MDICRCAPYVDNQQFTHSFFAFRAFRIVDAMIISVIATLAALFGVGAMKTIFSRKNWVRSGLEMMIIGACASAITYMIGKAFSFIF